MAANTSQCSTSSGTGGGSVLYPMAQAMTVAEMGVDRGGLALAVSEQPPDGVEPDAVHDALRGPCVPAVVDAKAGQSGFFADAHPERVKAIRHQVLREHSRRAFGPWQGREQPCRFRPEPDGARSGLGVFETRARAVSGQLADFVPLEVDDSGEPRPGEGQQADCRDRLGMFFPASVQRRAEALQLLAVEVSGVGPVRVPDDVGAGVGDMLA